MEDINPAPPAPPRRCNKEDNWVGLYFKAIWIQSLLTPALTNTGDRLPRHMNHIPCSSAILQSLITALRPLKLHRKGAIDRETDCLADCLAEMEECLICFAG